MAYLGWTERETLDTTIPAIELAYDGWLEKERMIGRIILKDPPTVTVPAESSESILAVFRQAATKPREGM